MCILLLFSGPAYDFFVKRHEPAPQVFCTTVDKNLLNVSKERGKLVTYKRDIICLPKSFSRQGNLIDVPRKKDIRRMLAVNKLIGKI